MEINFCPRWLLFKLGVPADAQSHVALFFSSLVVLIASPIVARLPHICLVRALFGIPCPGCGVMHAMAALSHMDLAAAWHWNPAAFLLSLLLLFQLVARPMALVSAPMRPTIAKISQHGSYTVTGFLLLIWVCRLFLGGIHGSRILP